VGSGANCVSANVKIPTSLPTGKGYLLAVIDPAKEASEQPGKEANNKFTSSYTIDFK